MASKRKTSSSKASSSSAADSSKKKMKQQVKESVPAATDSDFVEEPVVAEGSVSGSGEGEVEQTFNWVPPPRKRTFTRKADTLVVEDKGDGEGGVMNEEYEGECLFSSEPIAVADARKRWPQRYLEKKNKREKDETTQASKHFTQAKVDGETYNLHDNAYVKAGKDEDHYICKIVEMFESVDGSLYFNAQWYYRAKDTVIGDCDNLIKEKCVFLSEVKDDNPLDCLIKKLTIVHLPSTMESDYKAKAMTECDYYYEKMYLLPYTTFVNVPPTPLADNNADSGESTSTVSTEVHGAAAVSTAEVSKEEEVDSEMTLMDIYSGCGGMSTGLCLGANRGGVKLVTKWAIDLNPYACESLRLNHPETQVRNESAEDLLSLMVEWEKLCESFSLIGDNVTSDQHGDIKMEGDGENSIKDENEEEEEDAAEDDSEVFEVEEILEICYGDPNKNKKAGLHFKVRWKGYGPEEDTWEPREGLGECEEKLKEFVTKGFKSKLLPLPGKIDVICGGPPCQGISGFNRFRNSENPLMDEKNKQLQVFMDIVTFLKPRFVLMENVVDILKFAKGFLGRYALGRLVGMGYQARIGMMAAGAYGLPQFRMRVFLWGALSTEKLPQYPLPTHNVVVRGVVPTSFESNVVAYEEGKMVELEQELFLYDALSDLPTVENSEQRDEIPYQMKPRTNFQNFIRLKKEVMYGCLDSPEPLNQVLYDHRPLRLNTDDYQRVQHIPRIKGANFRNLAGVRVNPATNKVEWDPNVKRVYLPSGKPLVPDYAMSFVKGTSTKPFARLWWDEIVPTVVTRAEPHNHALLHPAQDRVLTIRENARIQGFPDYYKLIGPVKERYIQVGNAVAVPVARALGYSLALAFKGDSGNEPVLSLPANFSRHVEVIPPAESS